jgi:hypothetical protein
MLTHTTGEDLNADSIADGGTPSTPARIKASSWITAEILVEAAQPTSVEAAPSKPTASALARSNCDKPSIAPVIKTAFATARNPTIANDVCDGEAGAVINPIILFDRNATDRATRLTPAITRRRLLLCDMLMCFSYSVM